MFTITSVLKHIFRYCFICRNCLKEFILTSFVDLNDKGLTSFLELFHTALLFLSFCNAAKNIYMYCELVRVNIRVFIMFNFDRIKTIKTVQSKQLPRRSSFCFDRNSSLRSFIFSLSISSSDSCHKERATKLDKIDFAKKKKKRRKLNIRKTRASPLVRSYIRR